MDTHFADKAAALFRSPQHAGTLSSPLQKEQRRQMDANAVETSCSMAIAFTELLANQAANNRTTPCRQKRKNREQR